MGEEGEKEGQGGRTEGEKRRLREGRERGERGKEMEGEKEKRREGELFYFQDQPLL